MPGVAIHPASGHLCHRFSAGIVQNWGECRCIDRPMGYAMNKPRANRSASGDSEPGQGAGVSWFPGHMYKAQKRLTEEVRHCDLVLEMRDARLPAKTGNPDLLRIIGEKKRIVLLNKQALADPERIKIWTEYLINSRVPYLFLDADTRQGMDALFQKIKESTRTIGDKFRARGMRPPLPRLMVVGMPNVGKSTLINRILQKNRLKTAPTPGETRGINWVQLKQQMLLMDSPGMMLPKLERETEAFPLGWIGCIRDRVLGVQRLAETLLSELEAEYPGLLKTHLPEWLPGQEEASLLAIGQSKGYLRSGAEVDLHKAGEWILREFRRGAFGRVTLELPKI